MQHLRKKRKFRREINQRNALIKSLFDGLVLHEKIKTTEAKAKEIHSLIDKIINRAKEAQKKEKKVATIRLLSKVLNKSTVKKLSGKFIEKFNERKSGYTRVIKLSPRKSDNARMAIIEFV
ncbi:MAG: 50S ribosomal protein L17 [Candidatus Moranbacteria bacterium CG_4_9_14_3_um_filter_36_9]|nr:MAG: 50S ribosomal protein L17 [Candidatus Moranbacteria bacterium CG_4_9_14_3_um_filter_36_9]